MSDSADPAAVIRECRRQIRWNGSARPCFEPRDGCGEPAVEALPRPVPHPVRRVRSTRLRHASPQQLPQGFMHMSSTPRTSIIMPVYNTASTVVAAIESVLAQTDPDFELLVMVDGSPDDSARLIADYLRRNADERVRVFDNPRTGAPPRCAIRAWMRRAAHRVAFLDSDARSTPTFLEQAAPPRGAHTARRWSIALTPWWQPTARPPRRLKGVPSTLTGQRGGLRTAQDELSPTRGISSLSVPCWRVSTSRRIFAAPRMSASSGLYLRAQSVTVIDEPLYAYAVNAGSLTWAASLPWPRPAACSTTSRNPCGARVIVPPARRVREALTVARVLAYLNNAQQALIVGGEDAPATPRRVPPRFLGARCATVLRRRPVFRCRRLLLKTQHGPVPGSLRRVRQAGLQHLGFTPRLRGSLITLTQIGANLCPLCLHRRRWRPLPPRIPSPAADRAAGPPRTAPARAKGVPGLH